MPPGMVLPSLLRSVAVSSLLCSSLAVAFSVRSLKEELAVDGFSSPQFDAPQLTPTQFLFVSSPAERKVVYTELRNFKSSTGRTYALVDSGLVEPKGLAFDGKRSFLYIADAGSGRIVRYKVLVQRDQYSGGTSLITDGVQLCIMRGAPVEWVSVDQNGDVYFADTGKRTVNRIPVQVIERIAEGLYTCAELQVRPWTAAMQARLRDAIDDAEAGDDIPRDAPTTEPVIFSVFEGAQNPHVSIPGGVVSDTVRLYWTNTVNGGRAGSVVQGQIIPDASAITPNPPSPSKVLANNTETAYGMTRSNTMVFYTANKTGSGYVYGVKGGQVYAFVSNLIQPRGLVWDGDNTVYVADQVGNKVFSFPSGRLMDDAPLLDTVSMTGAFGLALFSKSDPAFEGSDGVRPSAHAAAVLVLAAVAASVVS